MKISMTRKNGGGNVVGTFPSLGTFSAPEASDLLNSTFNRFSTMIKTNSACSPRQQRSCRPTALTRLINKEMGLRMNARFCFCLACLLMAFNPVWCLAEQAGPALTRATHAPAGAPAVNSAHCVDVTREDGELHDLSSPMISSLAICYGLVEPRQGREMLNQLWTKMEAVGFKRFELGVPITLTPVRRGDYLTGITNTSYGVPRQEDGSDTFGQYLNGGCLVCDAVYFITALHIVGEGTKGDRILQAMVKRQEQGVFPNGGSFQNGVVNRYPQGAEFFTWSGKTCGYEGHLTYSFSFLQAVLLREAAFRTRLLRPLQ